MHADLLNGQGIRLYNLFPRMIGTMKKWQEHLPRIAAMGFNAVYVNPFHYPGFSGSLYSPKDYFKFNPQFFENSHQGPNEQLRDFITACRQQGLLFIMDLVINHTAIDCTLIAEHSAWYKRNDRGEIIKPGAFHDGQWMEWGDLAEIDNAGSSDRDNLWEFWWRMMSHFMGLGVDGYRCDMAYAVPDDLWRFLIGRSREKKPGCLFLAESLGCSFQQVEGLARLGFDYLFNSAKYWDFNQPWGMEQYWKTSGIVPSVSFPESHDTNRLMTELNGDVAAVKRQLIFSTVFSKGIMIPIGFEFGFRRKLDVVRTDPSWWENTGMDFSPLITRMMQIKREFPVLNRESGLELVDQENWYNVFCFKRTSPGEKTVLVILNKDRHFGQRVLLHDLEHVFGPGIYRDISPESPLETIPRRFEYHLRPSEVKLLTIV
jgi:starch synthase (maltosyl-transferring)